MKESGILMPVSALPSSTGVGELGADTFRFIKNLKHSGVKIWQILPLNPAGYGNSPYQPYSSCAGDEIYISLEELYKQGLLKVLPEAFRKNAAKVDYQAVREWKGALSPGSLQQFSGNRGLSEVCGAALGKNLWNVSRLKKRKWKPLLE